MFAVSGAGVMALTALIAFFLPFFAVGQLALRELILEPTGVRPAVRGGWRLFRSHVGRSLLLLVIQQGIALVPQSRSPWWSCC